MKFGIRKPSLKKSLKARTTGKLKRSVKKALIPGYGKKGMGWIKNPKKAAYNKVYNKTSVSLFPAGTSSGKTNGKRTTNTASAKRSTFQNNQFESQVYSYIEGETEAMKVCKFCGAENQDSATVCSSCGGNEFKHKCGNCGTVFEEGNFCPKCGVKAGAKAKKCPNCGAEYFSAACLDCGYTNKAGNTTVVYANTATQPVKKRKTWLWVLGWIFIFPVPLTILMIRNQKMNKWVKIGIIAVAWILYLIIALAGGADDTDTTKQAPGESNISVEASTTNIKKLAFINNNDVTVKVGKTVSQGYLKVTVKSNNDFSPADIVFVSENPEIAEIAFSHDALTTYLYFDIIGVDGGETNVYATTIDGSVKSETIHVIVPKPIRVEKIDLTGEKYDLVIGETVSIKTSISPTNAEDKILTWSSSDETVATVDDKGVIVAVGGGNCTITASASNGVSSAVDITVDGTKTLMRLNVRHPREDDVNIGDEWSYDIQLNGSRVTNTVGLAVGDELSFYAQITESDDNPDVGSASTTHTVTAEDIANGFEIKMDVYVTENGGKNSGQSAHFVVTYSFSPNN